MSNLANSVNLKMLEGGYRIKRGDKASLFRVLLLDERKEKITTIEGVKATVILKKDDDHIYKTTSKVVDGTVDFTIKELLEQGEYILEIHAGGYVFPSSNDIRISVVKSLVDIEDEFIEKASDGYTDKKRLEVIEKIKSISDYELYEYEDKARYSALLSIINFFDVDIIYSDKEMDFVLDAINSFNSLKRKAKPLSSISRSYGEDFDTLTVSRAEIEADEITWEIASQSPEGTPFVELLDTKGFEIRVKISDTEDTEEDEETPERSATIRATYLDEVSEITI